MTFRSNAPLERYNQNSADLLYGDVTPARKQEVEESNRRVSQIKQLRDSALKMEHVDMNYGGQPLSLTLDEVAYIAESGPLQVAKDFVVTPEHAQYAIDQCRTICKQV